MAMNIMVVDDSTLTRKAIRHMLAMTGIDVVELFEASNGREAINILAENHVDLVLADLNMPVMDGFELIYKMRGNEATRDIPVVIVSTESSVTGIERLLADGVKDYLHKPFKPEQFKEVIERTIGV